MPRLIKERAIVADPWTLIREIAPDAPLPAAGTIVPLAFWLAHRDALRARGEIAVWLGPTDDPAALAADVGALSMIAIDFPSAGDGRGYSTGRLLRERYGFRGELRAIGDVGRDQLFLLAQCGFEAFAIPDNRDAEAALAGLGDYSASYAPTVADPRPHFRRRDGAAPNRDRWLRSE